MAQKISIIIPNYNGVEILKKTLPNVIKNSVGSEIIIVDDASTDNSVSYIHRHFKKIRVIRLKKNVGFAEAVNRGVINSSGDYIVLLNSDVSPRKNYIQNALRHFKDNNVFGVGFLDYSHENGKVKFKGKGNGFIEKGFILHSAASIERGKTLWISGGSGIFNKNIYIKLGGFDKIYAPYYWEDIDLSFRAWKAGHACIFEPLSVVDHYHEEGAILKTNKAFKIKSISYKNQIIFFWKNVQSTKLILLHIFWLPYHLLKSLLSFDFAFIYGLILALNTVPRLILNEQSSQPFIRTESEILNEVSK